MRSLEEYVCDARTYADNPLRALLMMVVVVALLLPYDAGAIVHTGNPGTRVHLWTRPSTGWTVDTATAAASTFALQDCNTGRWTAWRTTTSTVHLGARDGAPAGTWCAMHVRLLQVRLKVSGPGARTVVLELDKLSSVLTFHDAQIVAGQGQVTTWLIAIGADWLPTVEAYLEPGETRTIGSGDDGYEAVVGHLEQMAMHLDHDGDEGLDVSESLVGAIAE
jgi:hypothetical protein